MKRYYLGVDIGTCESKGVLVDESYAVAASASQSHVIENPRPNYFEMDAEIWWKDFCAIAKPEAGADRQCWYLRHGL